MLHYVISCVYYYYYYYSSERKGSTDSSHSVEHPAELIRTRTLDALHLKFNAETGSLLPLALR